MPRISAVILARNEEKNLRYCLETVRWCDEIVVVDMESSDRTAEIAREFTDRVFLHELVPAFDIGKRLGLEKATGDWILLLDADEMIPRILAKRLRRAAQEDCVDIVEIPFKHYILGEWTRHTGWGYTPLPRFFRKGSVELTRTIHGYMRMRPEARVLRLEAQEENCVYHFNYVDSAHFVEKLNRYTSIEADDLYRGRVRFSRSRLVMTAAREFAARYIRAKGYREGIRGFSLSVMMAFYRALSYIKLWERYHFEKDPVVERYARIRNKLLDDWKTPGE